MSSIARRLGQWMILGGGLFVAALFAALDHMIDAELYERFDSALVQRARAFVDLVAARDAGQRAQVDAWPEFASSRHEDFYQVWDEHGVTVARAASNRGADLSRPAGVAAAKPLLFDLVLPDGHRGRGALLGVWRPGHAQPWTVVLASEREAVDALESRIHRVLVYGALASLLLMLVLSLAAVRAGLAPLRHFGENAARRALSGRAQFAASAAPLPAELVPIGASLDRAFDALAGALVREQRFARAVAHELRTPLAEMSAVVERLGGALDEARLAALRASLGGMTRTVDGLIALARYEGGLETPAIEPVELATLARQLLAARAADVAARGLTVDCELPPELWVTSDAALLERILANLVGNAIDHAPDDSRIAIAVRRGDGGLTFAISNAAPELEPADIAQLGERYFHPAGAALDRRHVGLGLALSIAIAAQLGLRLEFDLRDGVLQVRVRGLAEI